MNNPRFSQNQNEIPQIPPGVLKALPVVIVLIILAVAAFWSVKVIPAGHVGVATLFGKVVEEPYDSGMHFPVNPLLSWRTYDVRQKTHKERAGVPSQDQLTTEIDVSVQYRLIEEMAPEILKDTGTAEQTIQVHLVPRVRSLLREQGKTIERAEDFFQEETQQTLQTNLESGLQATLAPKGIEIDAVLIRDITLPQRLIQQIEQKKEVEQQAERQKAELQRFETEQQQKVVEAEAKRKAAEQEAEQRRLLADARAYEIEKINEAIAQNPAYIQLEALNTLQSMSKDPASKLYFLNSDSPQPLPLMNMGESTASTGAAGAAAATRSR